MDLMGRGREMLTKDGPFWATGISHLMDTMMDQNMVDGQI